MPGYSTDTGGQYTIPYIVQPQPVSQVGEARAALIAANALDAIRRALPNGGFAVFAEGTYTGTFASGGNSSVGLSNGGGTYSLDAIVAGVWVRTAATQYWTGIPDSTTAYLYAQLTETNIYAGTQVSSRQGLAWLPVVGTTGITPANSLLLAVATTNGATITIVSSALSADLGLFAKGKPYWNGTPNNSFQVYQDEISATVSVVGLTTNSKIFFTKTSPGPNIDYVQKAGNSFTVFLTGPATPAAVTFDYHIDQF